MAGHRTGQSGPVRVQYAAVVCCGQRLLYWRHRSDSPHHAGPMATLVGHVWNTFPAKLLRDERGPAIEFSLPSGELSLFQCSNELVQKPVVAEQHIGSLDTSLDTDGNCRGVRIGQEA